MNAYLMALAALIAMVALGAYMWPRRRLYQLSWRLPGPSGYPVIGSAYFFLDATKVVKNVMEFGTKYGNLSKMWMGHRLFVYVDEPDHVDIVLNSPACINKGESYKYMETYLGLGLITAQGKMWRHHRRLLNPSFAYNITSKFTPIINRHMRILMGRLDRCANGEPFDMHEPMRECSMDLICETTMDRVGNLETGKNKEYLEAIHNVLESSGVRIFNPILQPDLLYYFSEYHTKQQKNLKICNNIVNDIIASKSATIRSEKLDNGSSDSFFGKEKSIFIDRVLNLMFEQKEFSIENARDETNTILFAGYETTANTLSSVMLMLAMYPDLQERVYEECRSVSFADDEDITNESLAHLKYLDMFIKETLRMLPAVPFLTRATTSDVNVGGLIIPPGVELVINCIGMHRSEQNFKDPLTFDPDHFLTEAIAQRHPFSYLPFSAGPRSCIGPRYAMSVLKICTIYMTRNYRLRTRMKFDDLNFRMNITLNLLSPPMISIEKR